MILRLLITKESDTEYRNDVSFSEFPISIGRDENNDIELSDNKKIISRKHAKIVNDDDRLQLIDLGSRNYTYLNEEKLSSQLGYELQDGDIIKIGEYIIKIYKTESKKNNIEQIDRNDTLAFISPFSEEVSNFIDSLKKLAEKHASTEDQLKDEYLRSDFLVALSKAEYSNLSKILSDFFSDDSSLVDAPKDFNRKPSYDLNENSESDSKSKIGEKYSEKNRSEDYSLGNQFSFSFDAILSILLKQIQGYWQFRQEFFGVTIYQLLPVTSEDKLKKYLFDINISEDESKKRLNIFKEELNKILYHQIGLLEGYREAILEGVMQIINEFDPDKVEGQIGHGAKANSVKKFKINIPLFKNIRSLNLIRENIKQIKQDPNYIEKKYFRPHFIKGYRRRSEQS